LYNTAVLKEAIRMKLHGLLREIDPSAQHFLPHTTPGAVSLGMFSPSTIHPGPLTVHCHLSSLSKKHVEGKYF
jgi:hypothetical protein